MRKAGATVLKHAFLILMALVSIYPVLWVIAIAFSPGESLTSPTLLFGIIPVPRTPTLEHFTNILKVQVVGSGFPVWLKNSAIITASSVAGAVALTLPAGYAFSRRKF